MNNLRKEERKIKMKNESMTYRKKPRDGRKIWKTVTKKGRKERKMEMKRERKYEEFDGQGKDKVKEDR